MKKPEDSTFPYVSYFLAINDLTILQASSPCHEILYLKIRSVKTFYDTYLLHKICCEPFLKISLHRHFRKTLTTLKTAIPLSICELLHQKVNDKNQMRSSGCNPQKCFSEKFHKIHKKIPATKTYFY